jgi:tRNA dimethylallyltransferase
LAPRDAGTAFYLRNLLEGLPGTPETNPEVAVNIEARLAGMSWSAAWGILHAADPVYAASIEENDWRRLERALNIIEVSGRPVSSFKSKAEVAYDYRCVYLTAPRLNLFARIDGRCERMVEDGLVEEVIGLANQGLNPTMPAAGVLGYGLPIPLVHALTSAQGRVTSCL